MRRIFVVAVLAPLLAGCFALPARKDEADARAKAAFAECEALRVAHHGVADHVAAVDCAIPKVVDAYSEAGYPFTDLVYVRVVARRFGAHNVDTGDATAAEYEREVAELDTRVFAEEQRRVDLERWGKRVDLSPPEILTKGLPALAPGPTAFLPRPLTAACFSLDEQRRCD